MLREHFTTFIKKRMLPHTVNPVMSSILIIYSALIMLEGNEKRISRSISLINLRMLCRDELRLLPFHERCHELHPD